MVLLISVLNVPAASLYTETFDTTTGGWQDRDPGKMVVTNVLAGGNPGGCLRGRFPFQDPVFPQDDAFIAVGLLSTTNFMGDYEEAEAFMLGFDFMATNIVPSEFRVQISSDTNTIQRFLTSVISTTAIWYSFRMSLLASDRENWSGDTDQFEEILSNVTRVSFQITRNDVMQQSYYLDNVFLDRLPDAAQITGQEVDAPQIAWHNLRTNESYRIEGCVDLSQSEWYLVESFTATSSMHYTEYSTTNAFMFYRMVNQ